jgi:PAS domain-containing protein
MSTTLMEIHASADGRHVGANDGALEALGYTLDQLVALPFGALSATRPEAAPEVWRGFMMSGAIPRL